MENPSTPLSSLSLLDWLSGTASDSGARVSETNAWAMPAVWRAVNLISSVAASLPLPAYRDDTRERVPVDLLKRPHPELTPYELWRLTYVHRCLWGNAYLQKVRAPSGEVKELWPIRPDRVQVEKVNGRKRFWVHDDNGRQAPYTSDAILHIPHIGYDGICGASPVRVAAQGIGLSMAAERSGAKFFGQGAMLSGVLQTEQRLAPEQAAGLKNSWHAKVSGVDNFHDIAVLDSGASFQPVTMPYRDAQFLESRHFQVLEIARMFGVPPFLLMETEKSTSWGTGLEQQALGFVVFDLNPTWLRPTESRVTQDLLADRGLYAEYTVEGLLRGDSQARAEFYRTMREVGAMSANDIRAKENMEPIEHGDTYLQPLNMQPLGAKQNIKTGPSGDQPAN
jgi:HK97 family phage portal protein